jgi:hypothetical protein
MPVLPDTPSGSAWEPRMTIMSSSQEPTSATAGQAATTAPTGPCPSSWATLAASVAPMPRPRSHHASAGTGAFRRCVQHHHRARVDQPVQRQRHHARPAPWPQLATSSDANLDDLPEPLMLPVKPAGSIVEDPAPAPGNEEPVKACPEKRPNHSRRPATVTGTVARVAFEFTIA